MLKKVQENNTYPPEIEPRLDPLYPALILLSIPGTTDAHTQKMSMDCAFMNLSSLYSRASSENFEITHGLT